MLEKNRLLKYTYVISNKKFLKKSGPEVLHVQCFRGIVVSKQHTPTNACMAGYRKLWQGGLGETGRC